MLIPAAVLSAGHAVAMRFTIKPSCCLVPGEMDFLRYADADEWADFRLHLSDRSLDTFVCTCLTSHDFPATVIVETARHNLLIYVTHGGDGAHVEDLFQAQLAELHMESRRPYTFVHGWRGLEVLLTMLAGHNPDGRGPVRSPLRNKRWGAFPFQDWKGDDERPPDPSRTSDVEDEWRTISERVRSVLGGEPTGLIKTKGYACGDLFFYDPKHTSVDSTVTTMLEFAAATTGPENAWRLAAVFKEFTDFMGPVHPQVVLALGELYLRAGELDLAERWLEHAASLEHRWLAITRTYVDVTPVRHQEPGSTGATASSAPSPAGDVTANKHVVSRLTPAVNDEGLWDFPEMEEACIPGVYSYKHALAGQGLAQGRLHRAVLDEKWLELPGSGDLHTMTLDNNVLLSYLSRQVHLAPNILFFWEGYVLGRWDLAIGSFDAPETHNRGIGNASSADVVNIVDELLAGPPGWKWFTPQMHAYYLTNSADAIRANLP